MIKSIQYFLEDGVKKLSNSLFEFADNPKKIAEFVYGVTDSVTELGLSIIAEEFELYDEHIRQDPKRKANWYIVRKDETTLITSLGPVKYKKTLFRHKKTGSYSYLLDGYMGLESHVRLSEDAEVKVLEEAVESSYEKGGKKVCITPDFVSKETVMNKIHSLDFPPLPKSEERKQKRFLYIDADEDHIALQFINSKDEKLEPTQRKSAMAKLVYLYEGIEDDGGRNKLINPVYFGGLYEGTEGTKRLWKEVDCYIENHYDTDVLEKVYVNGDGAGWIKTSEQIVNTAVFVLDKFHMHKYIIKATSHLGDQTTQARNDLYVAIAKRKKDLVEDVFTAILEASAPEFISKVESSRQYLLANWGGIKRQIRSKDSQVRCSAEGHISHIYSDRLSSRPLGWSKVGVDKMARLRVYRVNNGNMLDLVRYQKCEKVSGLEEYEYTPGALFFDLEQRERALSKIDYEKTYTMPRKIQKRLAMKLHIYGL